MEWQMDVETVILSVAMVLLIVGFLVGGYASLMRRYRQHDTEELERISRILVEAAEQMFENNRQKLDFVMDQLVRRYPRYNIPWLRVVVESAVFRMKRAARRSDHGSGVGTDVGDKRAK